MSVLFCVGIFVCIVLYAIVQYRKRGCKSGTKATVVGINTGDSRYNFPVRDFYMKSSYNSCASGQFKNDWVDMCALTNVIQQGCRVLDFELYMVDGKAVVATSNSINPTEKGTYNALPINDVLKHIADNAISNSMNTELCPNANDPLFLHFRVKTDMKDVYEQLANAIVENLDGYMLSNEFSYENKGKNLGMTPIKQLLGKVIIMMDKPNVGLRGTKLDEFVNILGNSVFMRSLTFNDVAFTPDMDELISFNKKNMTLAMPNLSYKSSNYNSSTTMQYGVQMNAMCFQTNDSNLQAYNMLFDRAQKAFILKPKKFRYIPVTIETAPPIDPALSYGYKTHATNYYKFNL
jgi:hypothetical protein